MTTGYVVNLDNGHDGYCVESLAGVTYCGETFAPPRSTVNDTRSIAGLRTDTTLSVSTARK
ncbi:hypothetical protein [Natronobacterium lacisalsi]|uniref:hypothetical protein n=1 Tax=Natronobacterium lacisalsi TaxID=229731 RepID=UPI001EE6D767|nr:hypothetical protein [Halobiforma lacisalsi]